MKVGIGSYALPWHIGVAEWKPEEPLSHVDLLQVAYALDVQVVQYCDNLPLETLDEASLQSLHRQAQEWGIDVEIGTRGLERERLQRCVNLAVRFGSPFVRVVVDTPTYHPTPEQLLEDLRCLKPLFADKGVKLAIENHDRFPVRVLAQLVEEAGTDWVGICFDTANSLGTLQGPNEALEALCPYVCNLHVKDVRARREGHHLGFRIEGTPVGEGSVGVPDILRRVREANPHANAIVELWTPPQQSLQETLALERQWLEQSVGCLKKLLG
ncbi:MAG: sugar phosphate isomerase/epimerase family protein [Armatimonadota bacterium]|nr:sugar phosphate isomerase/epimerase [bacterium]MDW8319913.1 sugar phosphate isomerase/epimerase family protein [Armatimonadota bacterium]